jgi:lipid A ethanolaminephosphotransferase
MLVGLEGLIKKSTKDILIVLHQMGNHGPAYYKRYPPSFEYFTPTCQTNQLEACTQEEIANSYDNALRYTDYFLSKVIALLKRQRHSVDTAMIYMSDHGESLGESGLYLHGLPYFIAPASQTHVPLVMWFDEEYPIDKEKLKEKQHLFWSQDNLFSTLLGLFEVRSEVYNANQDICSSQ